MHQVVSLVRGGWNNFVSVHQMYEDIYEYELMRIYIFIYLCTFE